MADHGSGNKHSTSDKKLDHASQFASDEVSAKEASPSGGPGHDPAEIAKHDDAGKDRLFEGREQHDEADKNSEKTRLSRDMDRHNHKADDDIADAGSGPSAKRKS